MAGTGGKGVIGNLPSGGGGGGGSVTPGSGSSGFTPGSVIIADGGGKLNQDNANFSYGDGQLNLTSDGTSSFANINGTFNFTDTGGNGLQGIIEQLNIADTNAGGSQGIGGNFSAFTTITGTSTADAPAIAVLGTAAISGASTGTHGAVGVEGFAINEGSGPITNVAALLAGTNQNTASGVTNNYGLKVDDQVGATNNYAIKTGLGAVNLGDVLTLTRGFTVGAGANQLPGSPVVGMVARVTDALAPVIGSAVAGSGAAAALCWWNGSQWTVIGI